VVPTGEVHRPSEGYGIGNDSIYGCEAASATPEREKQEENLTGQFSWRGVA
jgi:hypothetical protein